MGRFSKKATSKQSLSKSLSESGFIPAQKNRSSAAGVDLWWSAIHRMKWFRATRRSGFLFFPEGRRPRWEVDPPLRVREDWWVFERLLRFKEALVGFRKKQRASNPLANPWVKAGSSPHKKPQLCCWRRPLMVRHPYSEAVWAPSRAVGTSSLVPWGEKGLEKAVDPPLRVREDWWVFERPNYFYFFECQETTFRLSKNLF